MMLQKKWLCGILAAMTLGLTACTGGNPAGPSGNETQAGTEKPEEESTVREEVKTATIFQFKVDTLNQMQALADKYCETHPGIRIQVETVGGSADFSTTLKQKYAAREIPDMWACEGNSELLLWTENLVELTGEPWAGSVVEGTLEDATIDGVLYGQPINIEAYGFIYNKDLFAQAGIEKAPATFTELRETCEKLDAAGITPFVNSYKESWIIGQHFFNGAVLGKVSQDPYTFAREVGTGGVTYASQEAALEMAELLKLTADYSLPNPVAGDYNTGMSDFASGKAAILTSAGTWIQPTLDELNPDMNLGIFGFLTNDEPDADVIPVGVSAYWVIDKSSDVIDEMKDFLNWMATDEEAVNAILYDFQFMPAVTGVNYDVKELGSIFEAVGEYTDAGKTSGWYWTRLPEGADSLYAPAMQKFVVGEYTAQEMIGEIDRVTEEAR